MNTQHTPGPWWLAAANETLYEAGVGNAPLTLPISKPDARLIAAAPDLLAALDSCLSYLADLNGCEWIKGDDAGSIDMRQRAMHLHRKVFNVVSGASGCASWDECRNARAAIALARGET